MSAKSAKLSSAVVFVSAYAIRMRANLQESLLTTHSLLLLLLRKSLFAVRYWQCLLRRTPPQCIARTAPDTQPPSVLGKAPTGSWLSLSEACGARGFGQRGTQADQKLPRCTPANCHQRHASLERWFKISQTPHPATAEQTCPLRQHHRLLPGPALQWPDRC